MERKARGTLNPSKGTGVKGSKGTGTRVAKIRGSPLMWKAAGRG